MLDLGSSDGETLRHIAELRPDLHLCAVDREGCPEAYPAGCEFARLDLERDPWPWPDGSMAAVTCMHLVEHLQDVRLLLKEVSRVLQPGALAYFEMPHPKTLTFSSPAGKAAGTFTMNFFDDSTHVRHLAKLAGAAGLEILDSGTSRNWLFAATWPLFLCLPPSRKKFVAQAHWRGWSAYLMVRRP